MPRHDPFAKLAGAEHVIHPSAPAGSGKTVLLRDEGLYAQDLYRTPTAALGDLGNFIRENGGPDLWDEIDQHEIGSCWLRHGPDTELSYHARLDRVTDAGPAGWAQPVSDSRLCWR